MESENILILNTLQLYDQELCDFEFQDISKIQLFGLFVTGSWCPPCKEFEKLLLETYHEINHEEKIFEVVEMTSEKSLMDFKETIREKPWAILHFQDPKIHELSEELELQHIPMLYIITRDGIKLIENGRKDIMDLGPKAWEKWIKELRKQKERDKELLD